MNDNCSERRFLGRRTIFFVRMIQWASVGNGGTADRLEFRTIGVPDL